MSRVERWLASADPDRLPQERVDVLVVGSGVAGLATALALPPERSVLVATKRSTAQSATRHAQGGIAAVLPPHETESEEGLHEPDAVEHHVADTLTAGAGLCDPEAVRVLAEEGGEAIATLRRMGVRFDVNGERLALTREGGHSRPRILHAGGDATGAEVERALLAAVRASPHVRVAEHTFLVDLLTGDGGEVTGALVAAGGGLAAVRAGAVVLATGGAGQLYQHTTNPEVSTGDGIAAALRAGAEVADLEFVQFHPTALHLPSDPRPLISEAMRGEGAVLRDPAGDPVMAGVHPLADLAPRDVVTRAMAARMAALGTDHLYLDATSIPPELLERRFPTILARCRAAGVEPRKEWIPVSPAAHYLMGGVRADLDGRTTLRRLYAVGEAACTGVHGANRLASNSLLEGVVFALRIARAITADPAGAHWPDPPAPLAAWSPRWERAAGPTPPVPADPQAVRAELRRVMTQLAGVLRSRAGLEEAAARLAALPLPVPGGVPAWEVANLALLATALVALAGRRKESRGAHWRADFPAPVDAWRVRQVVTRQPDGTLACDRRLPERSGRPGSGASPAPSEPAWR